MYFYTYILLSSKTNKLYVGSSENLLHRIKEHRQGKVTSTKFGRPWKLLYYEAHQSKTLARQAELFYKSSQGRRQLKKKLGLT